MKLTEKEQALIEKLRAEEAKQHPSFTPKIYTDAEKIVEFDKMYKMALDHYEEVKKNGYSDEDADHWFFEACMGLLGGREMWNSYNSYCG